MLRHETVSIHYFYYKIQGLLTFMRHMNKVSVIRIKNTVMEELEKLYLATNNSFTSRNENIFSYGT